MIKENEISYNSELFRKGIHMISLSIPVVYIFLTKETAIYIILSFTIIAILIDIFSRKNFFLHDIFQKVFGNILRPHEKQGGVILNGASWVLISASVCIIIFPKLYTVVGFTILILSDTFAALIGRRFGTHSLFDKSWEGTSAYILSAIVVIFIYGILFSASSGFFVAGIIGAVVSAFVEAASGWLKVDDNFAIPISFALVMILYEMIFPNSISTLYQLV